MVDTTALVAGTIWPRFPYEVLQHVLWGDFTLVLSPYAIAQARRVLHRRFPAYLQDFEDLLLLIPYEEAPSPSPEEVTANRALVRDLTDVPLGLSAIAAGVDYLVSDDKDFTTPNQPIHGKLRILQSSTFLNEVMGHSHEELDRIKQRTWADIPEMIK
ncbi:MAG: PIN domain-containing protein [Chloroflexi bacterium]|nr:PIN domain-containing protein [Chloroflexota bacterium]